ncbi:MAG: hypothetical protein ACK542_10310, partial [Burkholderiales bacterium]
NPCTTHNGWLASKNLSNRYRYADISLFVAEICLGFHICSNQFLRSFEVLMGRIFTSPRLCCTTQDLRKMPPTPQENQYADH